MIKVYVEGILVNLRVCQVHIRLNGPILDLDVRPERVYLRHLYVQL